MSSISFLFISHQELRRYSVVSIIERYTTVLKYELASRHRFFFPANAFHRHQRRHRIKDLIHDLRLLKAMRNNTGFIQDGQKTNIENTSNLAVVA